MILDDPFDDPPDLLIPDRSPEPTREQLDVSSTLVLFVFFLLRQSHNVAWAGLAFCYVVQAGLKFIEIQQPLPPTYWD